MVCIWDKSRRIFFSVNIGQPAAIWEFSRRKSLNAKCVCRGRGSSLQRVVQIMRCYVNATIPNPVEPPSGSTFRAPCSAALKCLKMRVKSHTTRRRLWKVFGRMAGAKLNWKRPMKGKPQGNVIISYWTLIATVQHGKRGKLPKRKWPSNFFTLLKNVQ